MFIELTEITTTGITAGIKRQITINTNRIICFYTPETGKGTTIEVKRGHIRVSDSYDEIKELIA